MSESRKRRKKKTEGRADVKDEIAQHRKVLEDNGQISTGSELEEGQTHVVEIDGTDRTRIVRKRFSTM